jgi:hypothetical protein
MHATACAKHLNMKANISCREVAGWLPWYVNGTLGAEQCDRLHAHAAVCADCCASLQAEHRLADAMLARPAPSSDTALAGWTKLSGALDAVPDTETLTTSTPRRWLKPAAIAGVAATGLLAALLWRSPPTAPPSAGYRTLATASADSLSNTIAELELTAARDIDAEDVRRLAAAIGAEVAGGPDADNRYRLTLRSDSSDASAQNAVALRDTAATWLRQQRGVLQAAVVGERAAP